MAVAAVEYCARKQLRHMIFGIMRCLQQLLRYFTTGAPCNCHHSGEFAFGRRRVRIGEQEPLASTTAVHRANHMGIACFVVPCFIQCRELCTEEFYQNVAHGMASFGFLRALHSRPFQGRTAKFNEKESIQDPRLCN